MSTKTINIANGRVRDLKHSKDYIFVNSNFFSFLLIFLKMAFDTATLYLISLFCFVFGEFALNDRPIIGILTQETFRAVQSKKFGPSEIYTSYVKFVESSGARVVPLKIMQPESYYESIVKKLNGVLLPGGGAYFNESGYGRSAEIIYNLAVKLNHKGTYFPLWGTCLGMEFLIYMAANKTLPHVDCSAENQASSILLTPDYKSSKLFKDITLDLKNRMEKEKSVANFHKRCLTNKNFADVNLNDKLRVLATSKDKQNLEYIAVIEDRRYPFYGVQFHPEKAVFEWSVVPSHVETPHSSSAVRISQFFGNFFIDECRRNGNHFQSKQEEDKYLIYNCNPVWMDKSLNKSFSIVQGHFFHTEANKLCIKKHT